jgi:hypothetical protein
MKFCLNSATTASTSLSEFAAAIFSTKSAYSILLYEINSLSKGQLLVFNDVISFLKLLKALIANSIVNTPQSLEFVC